MFNAATKEIDFDLPPLPFGYRWRLVVDTFRSTPKDFSEAGREALLESSTTYRLKSRSSAILLSAEAGIHLGRQFHMNQRASGILLHPTSLSNRYPVGDLGPAATAFADFLAESGQHWWQMLPIGPAGEENSPYESPSAFAGNPFLLSPDRLVEHGLLGRQDVEVPAIGDAGKVNYSEATSLKQRWLRKAFENFEKHSHGGRQPELDAFVRAESFWLDDFSLFSVIAGNTGTSDWTRWEPGAANAPT